MRRLCTWLCAFALGGCAKITARDLIREGNAAYAEGRFDVAVDLYTQSLTFEPDGVTVRWNRACAAEAQVLAMKDARDRPRRAEFADLALAEFEAWLGRLPEPSVEDQTLVLEHRLSILAADERCDALVAHWVEQHRQHPDEEAWYARIVRQLETCGRPDAADEWRARRTQDFPRSVKAWHQRAIREFEPLWPEADSAVPYNANLSALDRIRAADRVIELLDRASAIDPEFRDAYAWRAMAYTQRQLARTVVDDPQAPEEQLEVLRARHDAMAAWEQQKAICGLDAVPECTEALTAAGRPCCPVAPFSPQERAADAARQAEIEQQLLAPSTPTTDPG